ncbi:hypothetical protein MTsPCn9_03240 [Croceitalea sp. MTPC9]|uniref:hypothetical protein n=1 Tax=unclassified Croceitalea TaxID=2632280 RepID=UPI002B38E931|nr:hypothetical protein MTsPCn6_05470 [Croceitalea sp. MTPC6]GMN15388.1 hypothetical protein MTsPCn9_03240 [Croceitalea sp. MTPC9]
MKNLNKLLPLLLFAFMTSSIIAQGPVRNRIKTLKVAYITEQLGLTSSEAQNFWPVYNAHHKSLEALRRRERAEFEGIQTDMSVVSDKDADKLVSEYLSIQTEKHKIEQEFIGDLQNVISSKKIILLFRAENNFKKRLLQQYRNKKGQR